MKFKRGETVRAKKTKSVFAVKRTMVIDDVLHYYYERDQAWYAETILMNAQEYRDKRKAKGKKLKIRDYGDEKEVIKNMMEYAKTESFKNQINKKHAELVEQSSPKWVRFASRHTGLPLTRWLYHIRRSSP
jgi:hypothetical protein